MFPRYLREAQLPCSLLRLNFALPNVNLVFLLFLGPLARKQVVAAIFGEINRPARSQFLDIDDILLAVKDKTIVVPVVGEEC